jgi:hypothetical protein
VQFAFAGKESNYSLLFETRKMVTWESESESVYFGQDKLYRIKHG